MRAIKFRAWDGQIMFNVDVMGISPCTWDCPDYGRRGVSLAYQPHMKVMQYTGLKDKNGKEIYEGDILDTDLERPYLVVEFRNGCFVVECRDDNEKYYDIMHPLEKEISNLEYHEVIGNTYENPELLR